MINESEIALFHTKITDLDSFYTFQLDKEGDFMAAFTSSAMAEKPAFINKYARLLNEPTVHMRTIACNGLIVGSISKFEIEGKAEITYWIDRSFWNKGISSAALKSFLALEKKRPLSARVAFDNYGSQRVLEKSGFVKIGTDKGFANARQREIEEFIYRLD